MSEFRERIEQMLWSVIGGEEVRPKLFTMRDARKYLYDVAADNASVHSCVLSVKPVGEKYEVVQLMLDEKGEIIMASKNSYLGRKIMAYDIDESVKQFLDGKTRGNIEIE